MTSMVPELWILTDQGWNPPNGHGPWAVLFLTCPVGLLTGTTCQVIMRADSKCSGTELAQLTINAMVMITITIIFSLWKKDVGRGRSHE